MSMPILYVTVKSHKGIFSYCLNGTFPLYFDVCLTKCCVSMEFIIIVQFILDMELVSTFNDVLFHSVLSCKIFSTSD